MHKNKCPSCDFYKYVVWLVVWKTTKRKLCFFYDFDDCWLVAKMLNPSFGIFTFDDWLAKARLSEALKITEGRHPSTIEELEHLASTCEVDGTRYSPKPADEIRFRTLSIPSQSELDGALVIAYADRISRMCSFFG